MRKRGYISIGNKLRLGALSLIISLLLITSSIIAVSVFFNRQYNRVLQSIAVANEVQSIFEDYTVKIKDQYVNRDPMIRSRYIQIKDDVTKSIKYIENALSGKNSGGIKSLDGIKKLSQSYFQHADAIASNDLNKSLSSEYESVKRIKNYLDDEIKGFIRNQLLYNEKVISSLQVRFRIILITAIILTIATACIALIFLMKMSGDILKGLENLTEASIAISKGDLSKKDLIMPTKDELAILAEAFNHMKNSLKDIVKRINEIGFTVFLHVRDMDKDIQNNYEVIGQISEAIEDVARGAEHQLYEIKSTSAKLQEVFHAEENLYKVLNNIEIKDPVMPEKLRWVKEQTGTLTEQIYNINREGQKMYEFSEKFAANSEQISASTEEQKGMLMRMVETSFVLEKNAKELEEFIRKFKIERD